MREPRVLTVSKNLIEGLTIAVQINRLVPRWRRIAVMDGFEKPDRRSDYCGANKPAGTAVAKDRGHGRFRKT